MSNVTKIFLLTGTQIMAHDSPRSYIIHLINCDMNWNKIKHNNATQNMPSFLLAISQKLKGSSTSQLRTLLEANKTFTQQAPFQS